MTTIDYLQKELDKALDDIRYYKRRIERLNNQLQQKENIIKEVREYIENNEHYDMEFKFDYVYSDKVLEILDKVGDNNE